VVFPLNDSQADLFHVVKDNNMVQLKQHVIDLAKVAAIEKNPGYHNRFNALSNY
jgi:hypothetical protein